MLNPKVKALIEYNLLALALILAGAFLVYHAAANLPGFNPEVSGCGGILLAIGLFMVYVEVNP